MNKYVVFDYEEDECTVPDHLRDYFYWFFHDYDMFQSLDTTSIRLECLIEFQKDAETAIKRNRGDNDDFQEHIWQRDVYEGILSYFKGYDPSEVLLTRSIY